MSRRSIDDEILDPRFISARLADIFEARKEYSKGPSGRSTAAKEQWTDNAAKCLRSCLVDPDEVSHSSPWHNAGRSVNWLAQLNGN